MIFTFRSIWSMRIAYPQCVALVYILQTTKPHGHQPRVLRSSGVRSRLARQKTRRSCHDFTFRHTSDRSPHRKRAWPERVLTGEWESKHLQQRDRVGCLNRLSDLALSARANPNHFKFKVTVPALAGSGCDCGGNRWAPAWRCTGSSMERTCEFRSGLRREPVRSC